ncbi:MAG: TrkA family potassium uptake protein [Planctomycetota bacterium]|nr:TrkA family potassium uptake protein [Planctomycetota bacterium]MDA1214680.1 TrkA family potassium uptake protein [Planctomycetota bacterium]
MHKVAVIGLGRFGMSLAKRLGASGVQVVAIDDDPELVDEIKGDVDVAVRLDATDEHAIKSQNIDQVDVCVIAIGDNFEAALLSTVLARQLGIKRVICRAQTATHAEIFRQIGADEVIQPETQAGEELARQIANPRFEDFITLADGYTLIEFSAPTEFHGKTLLELRLRTRFQVNLVAIKRPKPLEDEKAERQYDVISVPEPDDTIHPDDVLLIVGSDEALARLPQE